MFLSHYFSARYFGQHYFMKERVFRPVVFVYFTLALVRDLAVQVMATRRLGLDLSLVRHVDTSE